MLPSKEEGPRLVKALPRARVRYFPGRSHAILMEAGVDVVAVMQEEGFLVTSRVMSGDRGRRQPKSGNCFGQYASSDYVLANISLCHPRN